MPNNKKGCPDHYNDPLPKRLRDLIKERNITQDELSKAVGVSRGSIGQYANGDSTPKYDALIAIAKYFNTSTDYLLGLSDSRSVDISAREICNRTNLTDSAFAALSSLSRSDADTPEEASRKQYARFLTNEIIERVIADPAFLEDLRRYWYANQEILCSTHLQLDYYTGEYEEYTPVYGGALVRDPAGDDMALLRFKVSRCFDRMIDSITRSSAAQYAASAFSKAYPERFWKDADGNIAGPIWYVPARSGAGCYPAHLTFAQYEAEIKMLVDDEAPTTAEEEAALEEVSRLYEEAPAGYVPAVGIRKDGTIEEIYLSADNEKEL